MHKAVGTTKLWCELLEVCRYEVFITVFIPLWGYCIVHGRNEQGTGKRNVVMVLTRQLDFDLFRVVLLRSSTQ